jgi:hypothetical protein
MRVDGGAHALGSRRVPWPTHQSGPDLSCEAETCHADPSCRELVGYAANWSETGRLVGLDWGPQSSSS